MNFLKGLFGKLRNAVVSFWHGPGGRIAQEAISNTVKSLGSVLFTVLLEAAKQKVKVLEHQAIRSDLKAAQVKSTLRDIAINAGKDVAERELNRILELALGALEK